MYAKALYRNFRHEMCYMPDVSARPLFGVKLSSVVQTLKCISELQERSWNVVPFNIPCKNVFVCP